MAISKTQPYDFEYTIKDGDQIGQSVAIAPHPDLILQVALESNPPGLHPGNRKDAELAAAIYFDSQPTPKEIALAAVFFQLGLNHARDGELGMLERAKSRYTGSQSRAGSKTRKCYLENAEAITNKLKEAIDSGWSYKIIGREIKTVCGTEPNRGTIAKWKKSIRDGRRPF